MKLDRNSNSPLHAQIYDYLREGILSQRLKSDETIPSERELAEKLKVSRMTVRQAINALREEGLIYQKQGKGTFVSPAKMDIHTRNLNGFTEEMRKKNLKPVSKVLRFDVETATKEVAESLGLNIGDKVYVLERLRLADEIPMSVETTVLPFDRFPGLDNYDFGKHSLYQAVSEDYGVKLHSAAEDLEASIADQEMSELLKAETGSAILIVYRTVFAEENRPVEYTKSIYRADRYRASFFLVKK